MYMEEDEDTLYIWQ